MAKYDVTYTCGHDGIVNLIGPGKTREWRLERESEKMCPDCYREHLELARAAANLAAAEAAKEMELPELQGTEKQIAWANTLRQKMIEDFEKRFTIEREKNKENLRIVLDFVLVNRNDAKWFIDNRGNMPCEIAEGINKEISDIEEAKLPDVVAVIDEQKQIQENATVFPAECKYKVPAEIAILSDKITVSFEKNDNFREIVKGLGYQWGNGYWYREIIFKNGLIPDRAAELGNKLLNSGFPIMILDPIIRQSAIDGKFETECTRWVQIRTSGEHEGLFAINWEGKNDKLYSSARRLPGSKWSSPSVIVKIAYYKEVQDFANLFGFQLSKGAMDAIELEKTKIKTVVSPKKVKKEVGKDGLKEILQSGAEIIDDLKD